MKSEWESVKMAYDIKVIFFMQKKKEQLER